MGLVVIFSLPRSGSTMVQRLLTSHSDYESLPETWSLIPQLMVLGYGKWASDVNSDVCLKANSQFIEKVGADVYKKNLKRFLLSNFEQVLNQRDGAIFVEKTPRNSIAAREIAEIFSDDAKYILLVRSLDSIMSSMMETWSGGELNIFKYQIDLVDGANELSDFWHENKSKVHLIKYESLTSENCCVRKKAIAELCGFLNISSDELQIENIPVQGFEFGYGDHSGLRKYRGLVARPEVDLTSTFVGPVRQIMRYNVVKRLDPRARELFGVNYLFSMSFFLRLPKLSDLSAAVKGVLYKYNLAVLINKKYYLK